jgi:hypothetical protein
MSMRQLYALPFLAVVAAALPPSTQPATAQVVKCYKKTCLEYPDGTKICELVPVDCDKVQVT